MFVYASRVWLISSESLGYISIRNSSSHLNGTKELAYSGAKFQCSLPRDKDSGFSKYQVPLM